MKKHYRILFIPAGGLTKKGELPPLIKNRLDHAIDKYKKGKKQNYLFLVAGRETLYKPPVLDKGGFPIIESYVMAKYLIDQGIDKSIIRAEKFSMDTLGSIFFSKKLIIDNLPVSHIVIFTSDFLIKKTKLFFKWIFSFKKDKTIKFSYITIPSLEIEDKLRQARVEKEEQVIRKTKINMKTITSEEQFSNWLFTEHAGYTYGLEIFKIDTALKKTY